MTNLLMFREENMGHTCYLAVSTWLLSFCNSFSNHLGTFSSKMKSSQKREEVFRIRNERWKWNGDWVEIQPAASFFSSRPIRL